MAHYYRCINAITRIDVFFFDYLYVVKILIQHYIVRKCSDVPVFDVLDQQTATNFQTFERWYCNAISKAAEVLSINCHFKGAFSEQYFNENSLVPWNVEFRARCGFFLAPGAIYSWVSCHILWTEYWIKVKPNIAAWKFVAF